MALIDKVQLRISEQKLKELTNPDSESAASINTTKLQQACDDVEDIFKVYVGVEYDDTNTIHVTHAIPGVVIQLKEWSEHRTPAFSGERDDWYDELEILRKTVGGNVRVTPQSDSEMTAPTDKRGQTITTVRPDFDPRRFDGIRPDAPSNTDRRNED